MAGVLLLLTGCAGGSRSYASPSALVKAFVAAGGQCDKPAHVPEAMVSQGAHAVLCTPGVNMLIVFDSESDKNRYLAETLDGSSDMQAVTGARWVVMTTKPEKYASGLGGKVETG